jgi:hypothetical protein
MCAPLRSALVQVQRNSQSNTQSTSRFNEGKVQSIIDMSEIPTDCQRKFSKF